jgi:hypothetical protein
MKAKTQYACGEAYLLSSHEGREYLSKVLVVRRAGQRPAVRLGSWARWALYRQPASREAFEQGCTVHLQQGHSPELASVRFAPPRSRSTRTSAPSELTGPGCAPTL